MKARYSQLYPKAARIAIHVFSHYESLWYVSSRQFQEDFGIPFFSDHIRALTESFGSELPDAGNHLVR
jgi:hypothetical protein